MTGKTFVIIFFASITSCFSSENMVDRMYDQHLEREINGRFLVYQGKPVCMQLFRYLVEKQTFPYLVARINPNKRSELLLGSSNFSKVINNIMTIRLKSKLLRLISDGHTVELTQVSPGNPMYSFERTFLNQPVKFRWKITLNDN